MLLEATRIKNTALAILEPYALSICRETESWRTVLKMSGLFHLIKVTSLKKLQVRTGTPYFIIYQLYTNNWKDIKWYYIIFILCTAPCTMLLLLNLYKEFCRHSHATTCVIVCVFAKKTLIHPLNEMHDIRLQYPVALQYSVIVAGVYLLYQVWVFFP